MTAEQQLNKPKHTQDDDRHLTRLFSRKTKLFCTDGFLANDTGGARVVAGAIRVTFWGALAMSATAGVGALFGTVAP
jgi:hypothetical protein